MIRNALLVPTYLIYMAVRRWLPVDHPWKDRQLSYSNWCDHATPLCVDFGFAITISSFSLIGFLVVLWRQV